MESKNGALKPNAHEGFKPSTGKTRKRTNRAHSPVINNGFADAAPVINNVKKESLAALSRLRAAMLADGYHGAGRSLPAEAWRSIDLMVRRLLVTLTLDGVDVDAVARKDWRELGDSERVALGASARFLASQLQSKAALLW